MKIIRVFFPKQMILFLFPFLLISKTGMNDDAGRTRNLRDFIFNNIREVATIRNVTAAEESNEGKLQMTFSKLSKAGYS